MENEYKTVRFNMDKPSETVEENLTLSEAQAASQGEGTSGIDWFIGYQPM